MRISGIEKLKKDRYMFGCLYKAAIQLNRIYSFMTLILVGSKMITTVYSLFSLIYHFRNSNLLMEKVYFLSIVSVFVDVFLVLTFFTAADMPIHKVLNMFSLVILVIPVVT